MPRNKVCTFELPRTWLGFNIKINTSTFRQKWNYCTCNAIATDQKQNSAIVVSFLVVVFKWKYCMLIQLRVYGIFPLFRKDQQTEISKKKDTFESRNNFYRYINLLFLKLNLQTISECTSLNSHCNTPFHHFDAYVLNSDIIFQSKQQQSAFLRNIWLTHRFLMKNLSRHVFSD